MKVEWYAVLVAGVGILLWLRGAVLGSALSVLFFSLFSGGAALILGHSTVTPVSFAIIFLLAHLILSLFKRTTHLKIGLTVNLFIIIYCSYGAMTAYLLPKIFYRAMAVPPLLQNGQHTFYVSNVLHYSPQNLTTAIYLLGTLLAAVAGGAASADPNSRRALVTWGLVIAWVQTAFGLLGIVPGASAIIKLFRNATYAELVQTTTGGYSRISGISPEPSAYAAYAFFWFVLMTELWLRDVRPRLTGATAFALGLMIAACTSTTGYASIAVYAVIMLGRFVIAPRSLRISKAIPIVMIGLVGAVAALAAFNLSSHLAFVVGHVLQQLTVGKADTQSGQQRLYWAATAIKAFRVTWGLGIGAGSFRSSSLLLAIMGSTGVIGLTAFLAHFFKILKPLRRDTYDLPGDPNKAIAVAAAWTACAGLIPQLISFPTPDPSYLFGIVGGLALGWRRVPRTRRAPATGRLSLMPKRSPGIPTLAEW